MVALSSMPSVPTVSGSIDATISLSLSALELTRHILFTRADIVPIELNPRVGLMHLVPPSSPAFPTRNHESIVSLVFDSTYKIL